MGEDDLRSHLHSQDSQGTFMILVLWRQYSYREVFSLSLSQLELEIMVSDGRDTLSCLHQILLPFLFALSSEVISAAWRLLPFTGSFAPRFRVEFGCLCLSDSSYC